MRSRLRFSILALTLLFSQLSSPVCGQQTEPQETQDLNPNPTASTRLSAIISADELLHSRILSLSVLAFGALIVSLEIWVTIKLENSWTANSFKLVALTLIISGSLFLMTAGYSRDQLTPIIGLLGTVAGYILGQSSDSGNERRRSKGAE